MFFLLAITAVIAYAFNSTFMAPLARGMTGLQASAWRGLALCLTMLPLLAFVPGTAFHKMDGRFLLFAVALAGITTAANSLVFISQKHLPVGISLALTIGVSTLVATAIGIGAFGDSFTPVQLVLGSLMLIEAAVLGAVSSRGAAVNLGRPALGVLASIAGGVFMGGAYGLVGYLSRDTSPLLVGYVWEGGTGVLGVGILAALHLVRRGKGAGPRIPFLKILLASSPTAVGTACYAMATTRGPLGLAGAILATMGAFAAVFSFFILKEKLTWAQGVLVGIMVATLAAMKLVV